MYALKFLVLIIGKKKKKINIENNICVDNCESIGKKEIDGKCYDTNEINSINTQNINIIAECKKNNTKLIPDTNTCIVDCINDGKYKYEFNNTCYSKCPLNTINSKKNEFYYEIICPKEKPYEFIEKKMY